MAEYFYGLKFGEIQQYNEMVVLPVCSGNEGSTKYLTLKEAMDENLIEITEVDDSGDVPELKVKNFADLPVLILDGEELVGAKQNRIVNTTMLLTEKFETLIPVSCVEQGRWSYTTKNFTDSNRLASYQLRNVKLASVKKSLENSGEYSSDQRMVWDEIRTLQDKNAIHSPTSAMSDVYEAKSDDLDNYIKTFKPVEGQNGLMVFVNGEIIGLDVISSASAYEILHKKLIKSYALDSMVHNQDEYLKPDIDLDITRKFIEEIITSEETKNKSVGYGSDYRFASDSYVGSTLVFNNEVIHVSIFKNLEIEDGREMRVSDPY